MITAKVAYMGLFGGKIGKRWAFETPGSVTSSSDMRNVLLDALPSPACAQQCVFISPALLGEGQRVE
jgi:hypothetical protein